MGIQIQSDRYGENHSSWSDADIPELHGLGDLHVRWRKTVVAAYSPWINGLVEGTNKILLHVLKRLCAPNLGEDDYEGLTWDSLPLNWPNHLDDAITALNHRILPALKFSPKELIRHQHTDGLCSAATA